MKNYLLAGVTLALSFVGVMLLFFAIRVVDRTRAVGKATACFVEIMERTDHFEQLIAHVAEEFHASRVGKDEQEESKLFHKLAYGLTHDADFLWAEWLEPHPSNEGTVFRVTHTALRDPNQDDMGRIRQLSGALRNATNFDLFQKQSKDQYGVFLSKRLHLLERDRIGVLAAVRPVYDEDKKLVGLAVGYLRSMLVTDKDHHRNVCMNVVRLENNKRDVVVSLGKRGLRRPLLEETVNRGCEQYQVIVREQEAQFFRRAKLSLFGLLLGPLCTCSMLKRYWQQRAVKYETHCQDLSTEVGERREMQAALQKLLDVREDERRTVASDIHDGFVQEVVSAQMFLEALATRIDDSDAQSAIYLKHLQDSIQQAIAEGRRLVRQTQVLAVDEMGLLPATHRLIATHREKFGLDATLRFAEDLPELNIQRQRSVYRIIQESLNNVRRHSGVNEAIVSLYTSGDEFRVDVTDQGKGFDSDRVGPDSFGIRGMHERVSTCGGQLEVKSAEGEGTLVSLHLPLNRANQDAVTDEMIGQAESS